MFLKKALRSGLLATLCICAASLLQAECRSYQSSCQLCDCNCSHQRSMNDCDVCGECNSCEESCSNENTHKSCGTCGDFKDAYWGSCLEKELAAREKGLLQELEAEVAADKKKAVVKQPAKVMNQQMNMSHAASIHPAQGSAGPMPMGQGMDQGMADGQSAQPFQGEEPVPDVQGVSQQNMSPMAPSQEQGMEMGMDPAAQGADMPGADLGANGQMEQQGFMAAQQMPQGQPGQFAQGQPGQFQGQQGQMQQMPQMQDGSFAGQGMQPQQPAVQPAQQQIPMGPVAGAPQGGVNLSPQF